MKAEQDVRDYWRRGRKPHDHSRRTAGIAGQFARPPEQAESIVSNQGRELRAERAEELAALPSASQTCRPERMW